LISPPPQIIKQISLISEGLGKLSVIENKPNLRLRHINQMRTIQGSLAIEGNELRVCIVESSSGYILNHQVMEKKVDNQIAY